MYRYPSPAFLPLPNTFQLSIALSLLVVPKEIPQSIPIIRVLVDIRHTTPQTSLQVLRVPPEQPHDHSPAPRREHWPSVRRNGLAHRRLAHDRQAGIPSSRPRGARRLDGELCECEDDAGKDVDDDLHVDAGDLAGAAGAAAEDDVAAQQAGEEGVGGLLLAGGRAEALEEEHGDLVDCGELCEVARVLAGGAEDECGFFAEGAGAEEEDHSAKERG